MGTFAYYTINGCWLLFVVYWLVNAFRVKAVAMRQDWSASLNYKVPTIVGALLLWRPIDSGVLGFVITPQNDLSCFVGAVLCVAGLGVAIWARNTLAGNWSSNVTFKQGHELIKTGPYRFARHPIYTGIMLMAVGTAVAVGRVHSWLGVVFMFAGFWIKLKVEEAVMLQHFPDQYPAYRKQVKAIVPFIL